MAIRAAFAKSQAYLLTGGGCAVLSTIVIILGDRLGLHYALGSILSLFGVGAVGYASHSRWTFQVSLSWVGYGRFIIGLASGALLATTMMFIGVTLLGRPVALVSPLVTVLITGLNYLSARWAIERHAKLTSGR